ncbi:MAG: hypothetical protein KGZ96_07505 [Clostridia bacterium]|jgi:peptidoglycan hydrolase CwlO-like protein|nr:hypothetical protein [Clostridia bacterium]
MTKLAKILLIVGIMAGLSFGFIIGHQVQASSIAPGSQTDPLVAKSYLEEELEAKVKGLEAEIAKLTDKVNRLQVLVDDLNKKVGN